MSILVSQLFLTRVLRIRYRGGIGSALYAEIGGVQVLLTAAHVVSGMHPGDNFEIRFNRDWLLVRANDVEFCREGTDVAAICPAAELGEGISEDLLDGQVFVGQDVVYCGFPLGFEMNGLPDTSGWPLGLAKAAIFSGILAQEAGPNLYLFDTINNRGFSGGPILLQQGKEVKVAALVSGYKFDSNSPVYRLQPGNESETETEFYVKPNSGFMVGVPIGKAVVCGKAVAARQNG